MNILLLNIFYMIVIKLWGGMGNQLFQYALGYVLSKTKMDDLIFDTAFYDKQPKYVGRRAIISKQEFPNIDINSSFNRTPLISAFENRYVNHLLRNSNGLNCTWFTQHIFIEKLYKYYDYIPYRENTLNYYDGYWQSEKYFLKYRDAILSKFTPNQDIVEAVYKWRESLNSDCCVAVHIRRGDYVRKGNKSITQGVDYYIKAMEYINQKFRNPLFCIFSDDIEWCKKQFSDIDNVVYVENKIGNGDIIDLFSISLCNHGIMSISTFSWWGNWLRKDDSNSLVIYPEGKYFNDYFMPEKWQCISNLIKE